MITIYDVLEVDENASKEEIEKAYQSLILKYHKDPKLDEEANHDNEIILNKLKIAYDILSDDEKRKKYDKDLANKRAEELIQKVSVKKVEPEESNDSKEQEDTENHNVESDEPSIEETANLSKEEKKEIAKAAKKDFEENLKRAQKAEEEYNKAYNEAYNSYLRKMGYSVKQQWTLKRVKNLIISILVIILVCTLVWILPPTRSLLIGIYKDNFIVKALVDIIVMLFNAIVSIFK